MAFVRHKRLSLVVFILTLAINGSLSRPLQAQSSSKNILIFFSYSADTPWQNTVIQSLNQQLAQQEKQQKINVFMEHMDSIRLRPGASAETWVKYLQDKYQTIRFDMVISESVNAGQFLDQHPNLFPAAKFYMVQPGSGTVVKQIKHTLQFHEDLYSCMNVALNTRPDSRQLFVIGNHNPNLVKQSRQIWQTYFKHRVSYEAWTDNFSFDELYQNAAMLPPDALILYLLVNHDRNNTKAYPYTIAGHLAKRASVPVFTCYDSLMGSGVVGGYLLSAARVGQAIAGLIGGATPKDFPPAFFSSYVFDARQLERWNIPHRLLPADSTLLFQPNSLWHQYRLTIILIALFLTGETFLLITLTRALRAKQKMQAHLEERVEERTAELKAANQRLAELSSHDELTHLANRREFNQVLQSEIQRHSRTQFPLSLIMLDVDFFKNYNDSYGHVAGDQCLVQLATALADCVQRPSDLAVRYGGEEFAVLLPNTDSEGAQKIALCIQSQVNALNIPHNRSSVAEHVTVSIGMVNLKVSLSDNIAEIINLADEMLYQAKAEGRNRICSRVVVAEGDDALPKT